LNYSDNVRLSVSDPEMVDFAANRVMG
jgi:hypothetical protein